MSAERPPAPPGAGDALDPDTTELIACTICDALHRVPEIPVGGRLRCARCGEVMLRSQRNAIDALIASALSMAILVVSAIFFPFLSVSASGLSSAASLLDTAFTFADGITAPLAVALMLVLVVVPLLRAATLTYALVPLRFGRPLLPGARHAFHFASELRPWSMADIFIVGVAVALVKIGGMATVTFGPAFWMLVLVILIVILESTSLCEKTLWRTLELNSPS